MPLKHHVNGTFLPNVIQYKRKSIQIDPNKIKSNATVLSVVLISEDQTKIATHTHTFKRRLRCVFEFERVEIEIESRYFRLERVRQAQVLLFIFGFNSVSVVFCSPTSYSDCGSTAECAIQDSLMVLHSHYIPINDLCHSCFSQSIPDYMLLRSFSSFERIIVYVEYNKHRYTLSHKTWILNNL